MKMKLSTDRRYASVSSMPLLPRLPTAVSKEITTDKKGLFASKKKGSISRSIKMIKE